MHTLFEGNAYPGSAEQGLKYIKCFCEPTFPICISVSPRPNGELLSISIFERIVTTHPTYKSTVTTRPTYNSTVATRPTVAFETVSGFTQDDRNGARAKTAIFMSDFVLLLFLSSFFLYSL